MTTLAYELVPDELWALVEPLLPAPPRPPYGGRHRAIPDRACFAAIVYMARTSTPWRLLPARELGCGSPATCWRRLTVWATAGVFDALHQEVLDRLGAQGQLDWSRASVDSMSVRAKRGGTTWAQIRRSWQAWEQAPPGLRRRRAAADRGHHRGQRHRHLDAPGGAGRRPASADPLGSAALPTGHAPWRQGVRQPSQPRLPAAAWIRARIARRRVESSVRLGRQRWKVERSLSWLSCFRRLQVRWDQDSGRWFAFVLVACALVCCNRL
jgi:transposase